MYFSPSDTPKFGFTFFQVSGSSHRSPSSGSYRRMKWLSFSLIPRRTWRRNSRSEKYGYEVSVPAVEMEKMSGCDRAPVPVFRTS